MDIATSSRVCFLTSTFYWFSAFLVFSIAVCGVTTTTTPKSRQDTDLTTNENHGIVSEAGSDVTTKESIRPISTTEKKINPDEVSGRPSTKLPNTHRTMPKSPLTIEPTTQMSANDDSKSKSSATQKSGVGISPETPTTESANIKRLKSVSASTDKTSTTPPGNIAYPLPLSPVSIANVTVKNITHKSAIIFWEQLDAKEDTSYRLVGYKLTPLTMDVEAKVTDLFVNASKQRRHRLTQENLYHNTIYMFCVIPMMVEDPDNDTSVLSEVSNGLSVLDTSDCNSFKTPYNPLNPKALIAFSCAVFILAVFFCTAVTSSLYEKTHQQEEEERKHLVNKLKQAKRIRRKQNYGSDKMLLSGYKLMEDELSESESVMSAETKPIVQDRDGTDIELDKMSVPDDGSDTGFLLGDNM